jgi:Kelch motif
MKSKSTSRTAFFKLRASIIAVFCLTSVSVAFVGSGAFSVGVFAQTNTVKANSFTPEGCFWSPGPDMPTQLIRAVGVYFTDGNFYTVGGSTSDTQGSDFQHVLQFSTGGSFSWNQMGDTLPDNQVSNMACGVLTVSGTPLIYCVGGSAVGQTGAASRVFFYDPATDTHTVLSAADNWPGNPGSVLPGGFSVANNKLYILGGFNINVASTNGIWEFDPNAAEGSRWTEKVNAPVGIMFAPTCTINGIIYVAGASDFQGGSVVDTTNSFSFDPVANTIGSIAEIPRATGETRALSFSGSMLVMGGGRVAPNPSNEVDIYDPGTNTWSSGSGVPSFMTARRNFPTDTDGSSSIYLSGGYDVDSIPLTSMELTECPGGTPPPPRPSPTPRARPTPHSRP